MPSNIFNTQLSEQLERIHKEIEKPDDVEFDKITDENGNRVIKYLVRSLGVRVTCNWLTGDATIENGKLEDLSSNIQEFFLKVKALASYGTLKKFEEIVCNMP